jgi:hypothetical protein
MRLTISIFPSLSTIDDIANVIMVHATNERYVLITALCCSPPVAQHQKYMVDEELLKHDSMFLS